MSVSGLKAWLGNYLWRPSPLPWSVLLGAGMIAGILFWGGFHWTMKLTDTIGFCTSCHSMNTVYEEYKTSSHYHSNSGVRAICTDCHVPKEWGPYVLAKIKASGDLIAHFRGLIDTPEKFKAKRLELAQRVWAHMEKTDSRACRNCHDFSAMTIARQKDTARKQHSRAMQKGDTCISCHKGIVHKMPDMGSLSMVAFEALKDSIGKMDGHTGTAHPVETSAYYIDAAGEAKGGKVLAGIAFEVVSVSEGVAKIKLTGWRQKGIDRVLYGAPGKRILLASLGAAAQEVTKDTGDAVTIEETGQVWIPAALEGYIPAKGLTAATDKLWSYAEALYSANCALCHAAPHLDEYGANQWMGQFKSMVSSSNLLKEEARLVLTYLQMHSADMSQH